MFLAPLVLALKLQAPFVYLAVAAAMLRTRVLCGYRVLFFGSDFFAAASLRALARLPLQALQVVAPADKPKKRGRKTLPADLAVVAEEELQLRVNKLPDNIDFALTGWQVPGTAAAGGAGWDLGVVVSFGYKLPPAVLEQFPLGVLNVHPSLLPLYRGAAPIQSALLHDDDTTGVSIISLTSRMDQGPIVRQRACAIEPTDTYQSLKAKLEQLGASELVEVVSDLEAHLARQLPQPHAAASRWGGKIKPERARVRCTTQSAKQVRTTWRALHGFLPAYTYVPALPHVPGQTRLLLRELDLQDTPLLEQHAPGTMWYDKPAKRIRISCACGSSISVLSLQLENKKIQDAVGFGNAYLKDTPAVVSRWSETCSRDRNRSSCRISSRLQKHCASSTTNSATCWHQFNNPTYTLSLNMECFSDKPDVNLFTMCVPDWTDTEVYTQYLGPTGSLAVAEKLWNQIGNIIPVEAFHNYYPVTAFTAGLAGSLPVTAPSGTAVGATSIPLPSLTGPTTLHPAGSSSSTTIHPIHPSTFSTPRTATTTPSTPILPSAPAAVITPTLRSNDLLATSQAHLYGRTVNLFMSDRKGQGDKGETKPPETDEENEEPEEVEEEDSVDKNDSTYVPTDEDEDEVHYRDHPSVKKPNSAISKRTRHQDHNCTNVKRHKTQTSPDTSATTSPVLSHSSPDFDVITQQDKVNDQLACRSRSTRSNSGKQERSPYTPASPSSSPSKIGTPPRSTQRATLRIQGLNKEAEQALQSASSSSSSSSSSSLSGSSPVSSPPPAFQSPVARPRRLRIRLARLAISSPGPQH
eukprot:g56594.t1